MKEGSPPWRRYRALAADYDGTLAEDGRLTDRTVNALQRLRDTGRALFLVTGRQLDDLLAVCPRLDLFDEVVAENGALLYRPDSRAIRLLAPPPPQKLFLLLQARGVSPLSAGRVIIATSRPHLATVQEAIRELEEPPAIIFNKDAVMILPAGIDKGSGLETSLRERGIAPAEVIGAGDAENDAPLLRLCGCSVAVAKALPSIRRMATVVTSGAAGSGMVELIDQWLQGAS
jgi:hydroxymethylpyrimidine pyrophosphatase-like HAD family hydrolase